MTEEEWQNGNQLKELIHQLDPCRHDRKLRLFAAACCRFALPIGSIDILGRLVEASEAYADRLSTYEELAAVYDSTIGLASFRELSAVQSAAAIACASWSASANRYLSCAMELAEVMISSRPREHQTSPSLSSLHWAWRKLANILREIVGNPLRPVTFDPRWRTSDVIGLARAIYDERAFERMPILADALMDAGCEDEQIIGHCRADSPHVRGCWVVDLILGKT
jgi:hypothetical protein